jgi:methionyl-tRNA synthetase
LKAYPAVISSSLERYRFREALSELMNVARLGNKYLADEEPWKVIKDNRNACKHKCMWHANCCVEFLRTILTLYIKLSRILKIESPLNWNTIAQNSDLIPLVTKLEKRNCCLLKLKTRNSKQIDKLEATKTANKEENKSLWNHRKKPFNLRILPKWIFVQEQSEAEKMPKANKLLILKVDTGIDVRTIVSGIAESLNQKILVKKVTVLVNLLQETFAA